MPDPRPAHTDPPSTGGHQPDPGLLGAVEKAKELVHLLGGSPVTRVRLEVGEVSMEIEAEPARGDARVSTPNGSADPEQPADDPPDPGAADAPPDGERTDPARTPIVAPLVGVFYRRPTPSEPPFVEVGDRVAAGQQVAIVEAMKLMNPVEADRAGTVTDIHVEDGAVVEFEEPIMTLNVDSQVA